MEKKVRPECHPHPDGRDYRGWHTKPLKIIPTEKEAKEMAIRLEMSYFYCEYGQCYHLCQGIPPRREDIVIHKTPDPFEI